MDTSGTVVPMATPTVGNRRTVAHDRLREFTRKLVDSGVDGLFPGSSIGEFPSLTTAQNQAVVETVVDAAGGEATVLAGCGDTSVDDIQDNVAAAADAGADAAVVVTPYYLGTTQSGLDRFFTTIADDSPLPLMLYNIPQLTGNTLSIDLVTSLAEHGNIAGLKDTSGDITYHYRAIEKTPSDFLVFQGATELATASLDAGANGLIAGPANVFPATVVALCEAHENGDYQRVRTLMQEVVMPVVNVTSDLPTAAALKYLVAVDGLDIGDPLPPLPRLTDDEREVLTTCYHAVADDAIEQLVRQ